MLKWFRERRQKEKEFYEAIDNFNKRVERYRSTYSFEDYELVVSSYSYVVKRFSAFVADKPIYVKWIERIEEFCHGTLKFPRSGVRERRS